MFGTKMNKKNDKAIHALIHEESIQRFDEVRDKIRQDAREQIKKIQEKNKKTYDKKRKEARQYQVGDLVAIKKTQFGTGQKLIPEFIGPYEVIHVNRSNRYSLRRTWKNENVKAILVFFSSSLVVLKLFSIFCRFVCARQRNART